MLNKTINGTLNLEGGYLKYEMAGEGMPLILSHAAFLDSRMFDGIWEPLARAFRVIRTNLHRGAAYRSCAPKR